MLDQPTTSQPTISQPATSQPTTSQTSQIQTPRTIPYEELKKSTYLHATYPGYTFYFDFDKPDQIQVKKGK